MRTSISMQQMKQEVEMTAKKIEELEKSQKYAILNFTCLIMSYLKQFLHVFKVNSFRNKNHIYIFFKINLFCKKCHIYMFFKVNAFFKKCHIYMFFKVNSFLGSSYLHIFFKVNSFMRK